MRKVKNIILIISCCLLFGTFCSDERQSVRFVKIGVSHGPTHSFTQALERFGRSFETQSNGRFRVKVYNSAQLGSEKEMQEMLTIGSAEMTVTGLLNTYEPMFAVFEMPYLYRDREHVLAVNTSDMMQDIAQSLIPKGLRLIGFVENGFRNVTNSIRPIHSPDDIKGMMIRTPENPAQIATFKTLGAIPTPLAYSELYTALLQGVVDGQENPLQQIWLGRLYEAQKHVAVTQHIYNSAYVLISERFWQSLNQEDQNLLEECVLDAGKWQLEYMKNLDADLEKKLKEKGVQFTYPDQQAFRTACEPAYAELAEQLGPEVFEIVKQIREMD